MKPEKKHLLDDLLDDGRDARREEILLAGGRILRRRRWRRAALQTFAVIAVLGVAAVTLQRTLAHRQQHTFAVVPAPSSSQPRSLTDDELLSLFPNTPVALATLPDGKKKLIFPRPGDEQRFVSRL